MSKSLENREQTRLAHDNIALQYYESYKDDKTDLAYFDEFLNICGSDILDLGCGMGHYSNYMYNKGYKVTGVDFSEGMLNIARKEYPNVEYIQADICDLDFLNDRKYDGVVLAYLLQHISREEAINLLKSLSKHLKRDAKLLIFTRGGDRDLEEAEPFNPQYIYQISEYNHETLTELLTNNDWNIIKMETKEYVEDDYSLAPDTLVAIAEYGKKTL